jgi:hypothetical protein
MTQIKSCLVVLFLCLSLVSLSQAPKYSNEFLGIGVSARALALGGAFAAQADDVTAGYWNPAGLSQVKGNLQLTFMHSEYFAGIAKYDYGALAAPVDATSTLGLSIIRFAIDDIIDSTDLIDKNGNIDYDRLKTFSAADYAFLLSFAKKMKKEGLRIGGNVKIVHRKAGDFAKAWGFGLDAGIQYDYNKWRFAAVGKDITSTFNAWTYNTENLKEVFAQTGNEIPENGLEVTLPRLIAGVAYKTSLSKKISFTPEIDADITFDGKRNVVIKSDPISIDPKLGMEFGYDDFIFLRAGLGNIQEIKNIDQSTSTTMQPNMGVGLRLKNLFIDYAFTNIGRNSGELYSNVFSLKLIINKQKSSTPNGRN